MEDKNYLDISTAVRGQFIYRIVSVERLLQLFQTQRNTLIKPKKWDDPFENFILQSQVRIPTGEIATFGFRDQFYVRIRSTIQRVAQSLSSALGDWAHVQAFIGKVRYLPNKELISYANSAFLGAGIPSSRLFAQTLLVKRPAFKHEREVRLLFFQHNEHLAKDDLYAYAVDPHKFVDQIMIDPRMSEKDASKLKGHIRTQTGFSGPIKRSLLYAPPAPMVLAFGETPNPPLPGTRDNAARP